MKRIYLTTKELLQIYEEAAEKLRTAERGDPMTVYKGQGITISVETPPASFIDILEQGQKLKHLLAKRQEQADEFHERLMKEVDRSLQ
jgi:hypothetical protein